MSDIVERLERARDKCMDDELVPVPHHTVGEAASKIVRLRAELATLREDFSECYADLGRTMLMLGGVEAERDRLRAEVHTVLSREAATTARHDAKLDALEAERDRLRDALPPEGYVLVPVEPTEAMLDRMMGGAEYRKVGAHLVWRRNYTVMLAAALKGDTP